LNGDIVLLLAILISIVFFAGAKHVLIWNALTGEQGTMRPQNLGLAASDFSNGMSVGSSRQRAPNLTSPRIQISPKIKSIYSQSLIKVYTVYPDRHLASKTSNPRSRVLQMANPPPNLTHRPLLSLPPTLTLLDVSRRPNSQIQATTQLRRLNSRSLDVLGRIGRRDQSAGFL
jgi:hypothetical protein